MTPLTDSIPSGPEIEFEFSEEDFRTVATHARENYGLHLPASKKTLVYSRLARRLRALQINSFQVYHDRVKHDGREKLALLSALTTNVTNFFREPHHFETLEHGVAQAVIKKLKDGQRIRIWSAGCSTGQEPYSIAITMLKVCPEIREYDFKILATDIDPQVVRTALNGIYDQEEVEELPTEIVGRYFENASPQSKKISICQTVKDLVSFGTLNLIDDLPFRGPFEVIFCRNVAIYFDNDTQKNLWGKFLDVLSPEGTLFIGHSERVSGPAQEKFAPIGVTTYKKSE